MSGDNEEMEQSSNKKGQGANKVAIVSNGLDGQLIYTCVACSTPFNDKDKLQLHLLSHYDEYKFVCGVCGKGLKRREHLDRHMQEHSGKRPHVCPDCGKGFKRKEHLNIHGAIHSGVKVLSCPVCNKKFNRKDHLQKHASTHNRNFMEQSYLQMSDLELMGIKTEVVHEYEGFNPIISEVLGSVQAANMDTPDTSNDCMNSTISNDESNDPAMSYEMAQQLGPNDDTLESTDPLMTYGPNVDRYFDPARPHICQICGKSYKRKDHLKIHSWTHKKKEKFCQECGKAFHTSDQLLVHMNLAHARIFEPDRRPEMFGQPVNVKIINKAMTGAERMRKMREKRRAREQIILQEIKKINAEMEHESPVNGEHFLASITDDMDEIGDVDERPTTSELDVAPDNDMPTRMINKGSGAHECTICHRKFKRKQHLKVHYNVHLKHQNHSVWCSTCNEGFLNASQYEDHPCLNPPIEGVNNGRGAAQQDGKKENNPMELLEVVVNEFADGDQAGEALIPAPRRVYLCKYCPKSFKRKDHYKIHQYIHTGVKTVFCPDCTKGFYRKDHLQKHMIVHARLKAKDKDKDKKSVPNLYPIDGPSTSGDGGGDGSDSGGDGTDVKPEITIHAPSSTKLRVPLKIKVPYQMVMSMDNGEKRAFTVDPKGPDSPQECYYLPYPSIGMRYVGLPLPMLQRYTDETLPRFFIAILADSWEIRHAFTSTKLPEPSVCVFVHLCLFLCGLHA